MKAYLDKKQLTVDNEFQNQYFIMGLNAGQVSILRSGVDMVELSLKEKLQLSAEERELYLKVRELKRIIASN